MARTFRMPGTARVAFWLLLGASGTVEAQALAPTPEQLLDMSLEELGDVQVTSVSRRAQRLSEAAAAVYVISRDDIRRSGATSLPEALRLAPNLQVARTAAAQYAISARGFNNAIGNKLQVLLDGRILYNPLFSGVFWDAHDLSLDDIDRIEVVSGPGSTLWGANAVNGTINVITRAATASRGAHVRATADRDTRVLAARYGGGGDTGALRVSATSVARDESESAAGTGRQDAFRADQLALRGDWTVGANRFRFGAAAQRGRGDTTSAGDLLVANRHVAGEWQRTLPGEGAVRLQAYLDWRYREIPTSIAQHVQIADVEFQHDVGGLEHHRLTWGLSHRSARDRVESFGTAVLLPPERRLRWTSAYVQDEVLLGEDWRVTGGLRLEHNSYTGLEVLPSLRVAWTPTATSLWWAALTRAVRTPSRFDRDVHAPAQPPFLIGGGPDFRSEVARIAELGFRAQRARWSVSVTAFRHDYTRLRTFELQPGGASFEFGNGMRGTGRGVEAWGTLQAAPRWRLRAGASFLDQDLRLAPDSHDVSGVIAVGNDPRVQWQLHSSHDLPHRVDLDLGVRHVGELPSPRVPAYTAVDLRVGWRPTPRVDLSLVGRNLFDAGHVEFGAPAAAAEFGRTVQADLRWDF